MQLFEVQAVHDFLREADEVFHQKRLGDEVFDAVHHGAELFFDVAAAGHEEKRNVLRGFAGAEFFIELTAIEAGHFVIAEDDVGGFVEGLDERLRAVGGGDNVAVRFHAFDE